MTKYLLLKHYRGAPEAVNDVPMDQWTPEEVEDHLQFMADFAARLEGTGEYVDGQALSPEGTFVRYDGEGRSPASCRQPPEPAASRSTSGSRCARS
jgi:hypothetical protein